MYIEKIMYSITCDHCGKDACDEAGDNTAVTPKSYARDIAVDGEWAIIQDDRGKNEKHYCTDCHTTRWDDEGDVQMFFVDGVQVGVIE